MNARWADLRAAAVAADEAGFDGVWTWDHLRDPDGGGEPGVPEAWTTLTALAAVTTRIMLSGLAVNNVVPSGGAAGGALAFRQLREAGVDTSDAGFALGAQSIG